MSPAEVLRKAADLLEPEGAWTQGELARDKYGRPVSDVSPTATCWCAMGAIAAVCGDEPFQDDAALRALRDHLSCLIVFWNDGPDRTQAEVVATLRECADKLDKEDS